jgi:HAD superfamily hydrolase (TIGR01484 family)
MIKMFVSDIDGTMMQHGGIIDKEDVQALRRMAEEGVILCFASGRLDNEIAALMKDIGTNFHRISVNGVFVYTHDNEQLLNASFELDILPQLLAISSGEKFIRYISDEHNYYIEKKSPFILELEEKAKLHSVEEPYCSSSTAYELMKWHALAIPTMIFLCFSSRRTALQ